MLTEDYEARIQITLIELSQTFLLTINHNAEYSAAVTRTQTSYIQSDLL